MSESDSEKKEPRQVEESPADSAAVATESPAEKAPEAATDDAASAPAETQDAADPGGESEKLVRDQKAEEATQAPLHVKDRKNLFLGIAGAAAFLVFTVGAAFLLSNYRPVVAPDAPVEPEAPGEPQLSIPELLKLGREALDNRDFDTARSLLEEARIQGGKSGTAEQIEIFSLLAEVAKATGDENVAEIYAEYLARLRAELGTALELFTEAEAKHAAGDRAGARRIYYAFLLRSGELEGEARNYVRIAKERIAETWIASYRDSNTALSSLKKEREAYFDAR